MQLQSINTAAYIPNVVYVLISEIGELLTRFECGSKGKGVNIFKTNCSHRVFVNCSLPYFIICT